VRLWDPYDMSCARVLEEDASEISAMTFYEAWNILVTGQSQGWVTGWVAGGMRVRGLPHGSSMHNPNMGKE
jgi:hypothetical protein